MDNKNVISFSEYQEHVLSLFKDISDIFLSQNVKYWAHSGTLLGIIRHNNSLIPWDDDIDIMISYKEWEEKKENIHKQVDELGHILVDYLSSERDLSPIKYVKIFSNKKYTVEYESEVRVVRPFVDIFFAVPSDSFDNNFIWWFAQSMWRSYWISFSGFDRYQKAEGHKIKKAFFNTISYPLKLFFTKSRMDKFLLTPFDIMRGNWDILRRNDAWCSRDVNYDINDGLIESDLVGIKIWISKSSEEELKNTFGKWEDEVKTKPHSFSNKHHLVKRNIKTNKIIEEKIND